MRQLRPGTTTYETAMGRAMLAYQAGASLEEAARDNRVNFQTLRHRIMRAGMTVHTQRRYTGKARINVNRDVYERLLDAHPRITPRQIADAAGISKTTVVTHLKKRGTYQPRTKGAQPEGNWAVSLRNRTKILKAVQLRDQGHTWGQISIRLGVPRSTVGTWLRQYNAGTFLWQRHPIPTGLWHEADR